MKDTQKELDRLEQELLAEDQQLEEDKIDLGEDTLTEIMSEYAEPAFDDPEKIHEPAEDHAYSNYANDYGKELADFAETGETEPKKRNDKLIIGLMITASVLCAGIIGILIYWLNAFLL